MFLPSLMDYNDKNKSKSTCSMLSIEEHTGSHLNENGDLNKISTLVTGTLQDELQCVRTSIVDCVLVGLQAQVTDLQKYYYFIKDRVTTLEAKADKAE
ncbi:hypothetical protein DPMN_181436 [Dreissena polymorpha]|uniref:Uncharacterized protein n=1 Tax=Dreissena polymorpha TaxID=45954 RepID=A0A9D4DEG6_DREPO|nr:hypothetical protein DPMN_181436 [Dreissena polymorpha]